MFNRDIRTLHSIENVFLKASANILTCFNLSLTCMCKLLNNCDDNLKFNMHFLIYKRLFNCSGQFLSGFITKARMINSNWFHTLLLWVKLQLAPNLIVMG